MTDWEAWRRVLRDSLASGRGRECNVLPWDAGEAEIYVSASAEPDDIDELVTGHAEWARKVREALESVGLDQHGLWECSLDDSFPSLRARKLWLALCNHAYVDGSGT